MATIFATIYCPFIKVLGLSIFMRDLFSQILPPREVREIKTVQNKVPLRCIKSISLWDLLFMGTPCTLVEEEATTSLAS